MKFLVIIAILLGIYMATTESGGQMYQQIRAVIHKPIDKAEIAKDQMEGRNNKLQAELDEISEVPQRSR